MTGVAWLLIGGFVAFMIGAVRWRVEYEGAAHEALPIAAADRKRLRWIHRWMLFAMVATSSGIGGLAWRTVDAGAAVATAAYGLGAALFMLALLFRLTVGEWAAERTVATGVVPDVYEPFARLFGLAHGVHMLTAYVSAVPLAWSAYATGLIPAPLAWAGSVWGGADDHSFSDPRDPVHGFAAVLGPHLDVGGRDRPSVMTPPFSSADAGRR